MDDDDDVIWGPPFVVEDDTFRKQTLRGCEFWFDRRMDVLEEKFQNERYCEQVWRILNEKKQDVVVYELDTNMASSGNGDSHEMVSSDSDKTLSDILQGADTSSEKAALDEDESTSGISDARTIVTIETRNSRNDTDEIEPETRFRPQEIAANDPLTVKVAEDPDTWHVLANKIEEAEEHSCSSLVTEFGHRKQALENNSSSAITRETMGGSTLKPMLLETIERVREKANATKEVGEVLKYHQQINSLQEPFTAESLLEICGERDKDGDIPCNERSNISHLEAVKTVVKEELGEGNALMNPGSILIKKRQKQSNKGFVRDIKQKVQGGDGEINTDPIQNSAQSTPGIIRGSSVLTQHPDSLVDSINRRSHREGHIVNGSVIPFSTSELKNKTGKELRSIAKELKVARYYKLNKEDLLEQLTNQLNRS